MIGAVLALALSTADAAAAAKLKACAPQTERSAMACMDRYLPARIKEVILDRVQPEYGGGLGWKARQFLDDALGGAIYGSITVEYQANGYPTPSMFFNPSETLMESYWLRAKGCGYDRRQRAELARDYASAQIEAVQWERDAAAQGGNGSSVFLPRELEVSCSRWDQGAR